MKSLLGGTFGSAKRAKSISDKGEEWTPSYAGGSTWMDFLLKQEEIVLEAKTARKGHGAKQISNELIIDAARYREHPACKNLIYDPDGIIANPRGVEADLR